MNLSKLIPQVIEENFSKMIEIILKRNSLEIKDIDKFMFHPGGVKILDKIDNIITSIGKNVNESRKVMSTLGNLSSSTVFFILEETLKNSEQGTKGFLASFGPGFSTYQMILEF